MVMSCCLSAYKILKQILISKNEMNFACEKCHQHFSSGGGLHLHDQSIHQGVQYTCNKCDKNYASKKSLNRHILGEHEYVRYVCKQCTYVSKDPSTLKRHVNTLHKVIDNFSSIKQSNANKVASDDAQIF